MNRKLSISGADGAPHERCYHTSWWWLWGTRGLQGLQWPFFGREGLPFSEIISAERIADVFARHGNLFWGRGVYGTAVMLWSFLGQVFRDGKTKRQKKGIRYRVGGLGDISVRSFQILWPASGTHRPLEVVSPGHGFSPGLVAE